MSDEKILFPKSAKNMSEDILDDDVINESRLNEIPTHEMIPPLRKGETKNYYERKKLYDEVWAKPVVHVAVQYGVSDTAIKKVCKALKIPVPPRGYWAKVKAGKATRKIPLPESKGNTTFYGARTHTNPPSAGATKDHLTFLPESDRQLVIAAGKSIELKPENTRLHKKITAYRAVVAEWNRNDRKDEGSQRRHSNYYNEPPFLAGVISKETLPRVYRLLDALYRQAESLGGSVNDDLTLQVRGEIVRIEITEAQYKIKHENTKEEARALLLYEDSKNSKSWVSKPQIRKYDYIFNGRLRFCINKSKFYKDTEKVKLEDRLGEILIGFYEESELARIARVNKEDEARRKEEEKSSGEYFMKSIIRKSKEH